MVDEVLLSELGDGYGGTRHGCVHRYKSDSAYPKCKHTLIPLPQYTDTIPLIDPLLLVYVVFPFKVL